MIKKHTQFCDVRHYIALLNMKTTSGLSILILGVLSHSLIIINGNFVSKGIYKCQHSHGVNCLTLNIINQGA